ncbi:MAG: hypothetical protein LKM35_07615 [Lachnospiraceae bacterium]|jgi:hypothetical protein|nr:hypothetical protein [Lachnospiraceae bacterium]
MDLTLLNERSVKKMIPDFFIKAAGRMGFRSEQLSDEAASPGKLFQISVKKFFTERA